MLSTVRIVSGSEGHPWTRDQRDCVLEIRSEHKLNDPTSFSILMADLPDRHGKRHHLLKTGEKVAVLVRPRDAGAWQVLFQGKVSEIEQTQTQGGVGSTVLYRGKDIRTIMAARSYSGSWSGHVDAVMRYLIGLDFPDHHVEAPENNTLDERENPLGQNSNNLDFLRNQAIAFGHNFWVGYETVPASSPGLAAVNPIGESPPSVTITPVVNWARSPFFAASHASSGATSALGAAAVSALPGVGDDDAATPIDFKVNVTRAQCPNVTAFSVVSEGERVETMPSQSGGQGASGLPGPPTDPLAPPPDSDTPNVHFVAPNAQSANAQDGEQVNAALAQERSFDRKVRLSTTRAMLGRLCLPNALATLEGVPKAVSGLLFRISEATHVIRIDGHWMDAELESDGTTEPGAAAGGLAQAIGA